MRRALLLRRHAIQSRATSIDAAGGARVQCLGDGRPRRLARCDRDDQHLVRSERARGTLRIPQVHEPWRADELWRTTCFEAFFAPDDGQGYREWNFAPHGNWAAYDFTAYREGMAQADVRSPPYIRMEDNFTWWTVGATIAVEAERQWRLGLSAVIEEKDGTKSYWALAHPSEKPDFHLADCFVANLP